MEMLQSHRLILMILSICLFTSCGIFKKGSKQADEHEIENFDSFYDRFHQDADFQMKRLRFPLGGASIDGDGEKEWTKENWHLMKVRIYDINDPSYKVDYEKTATSFYQKFWAEDAGFFAEYRFELIKGRWYLTYAKDVNL